MTISVIKKEMGCSQSEFFRQFKIFARSFEYSISSNHIVLKDQQAQIKFRISPHTQRKLGALILPRLLLEIQFEGYNHNQIEQFLQQFNQSFQRGGG